MPALTTVAVEHGEIGTSAGRLLVSRMTGETDEPVKIDVGFSVLIRDST